MCLLGFNLLVTIIAMRAPGMTWTRLPIFVWSVLATSILMMLAAPMLIAALLMGAFDRTVQTAFYVAGNGGSSYLYQNLFWVFGHPEVYIVALPGFGIVLELLPVFSRKAPVGLPRRHHHDHHGRLRGWKRPTDLPPRPGRPPRPPATQLCDQPRVLRRGGPMILGAAGWQPLPDPHPVSDLGRPDWQLGKRDSRRDGSAAAAWVNARVRLLGRSGGRWRPGLGRRTSVGRPASATTHRRRRRGLAARHGRRQRPWS